MEFSGAVAHTVRNWLSSVRQFDEVYGSLSMSPVRTMITEMSYVVEIWFS